MSAIFGLEGLTLSRREKAFFRDANPWAFILFARNVDTPEQVTRLTQNLRDTVGRDCLVFIDQEGGRVQRLTVPHWHKYPSYAQLSASWDTDKGKTRKAVFWHHRLIADDLRAVGVTANCAPVLDVPVVGADDIISDRAFSSTAEIVSDLANAAMAGLLRGGVVPVIKHIPGHGRATVDSHKSLPVIDTDLQTLRRTDFAPFVAFSSAPMAMTAHAVYTPVDPEQPVTLSKPAITQIIRNHIGFDGLLMSDDLDMKALSGTLGARTRKSLAAGCDVVLHCSGDFDAMQQVAKAAKTLSGRALDRALIANACAAKPVPFSRDASEEMFAELLDGNWAKA